MKEYHILIDLSYSENIEWLKFKSDYYIDSSLNIIDSISEGQGCMTCNELDICKDFKKHNKFILNILTNKLDDRVKRICKDLENKLKNEVPIDVNFSLKIKEKDFPKIYENVKSYKYIILGENIHSYFAAYQNENDIEDVIISGFQYGNLDFGINSESELLELIPKSKIYEDKKEKKSKFYIDNPLMKSEFISYTSLDYLE